jgi:hypothetical protein
MRDSHACRATRSALGLPPICGGEYTLLFIAGQGIRDFSQNTNQICNRPIEQRDVMLPGFLGTFL